MKKGFKIKDLKTGIIYDKNSDFEPLVLELRENDDTCKLVWCDMECFAIDQRGDIILYDECDNSYYLEQERFEVVKEK